MKKVLILFLLLVAGVALTSGCANNKLSDYTEISYDEFNQKKSDEDKFSLVVGSSTCSACANYRITMKSFIEKYQVQVFYVDISKLKDEEYNSLKSEISFTGTPTTVFYENGVLTSFYNRIDKSASMDVVIDYYKKNNYIG